MLPMATRRSHHIGHVGWLFWDKSICKSIHRLQMRILRAFDVYSVIFRTKTNHIGQKWEHKCSSSLHMPSKHTLFIKNRKGVFRKRKAGTKDWKFCPCFSFYRDVVSGYVPRQVVPWNPFKVKNSSQAKNEGHNVTRGLVQNEPKTD